MRPLHDLVFIKRKPKEEKVGELYIPHQSQKVATVGEIVACGPGIRDKKGRLKPMDVKIGDTVHFNEYIGMDVEMDGEKLVVMHEDEIEAVCV
jgi:chaperonin GroES